MMDPVSYPPSGEVVKEAVVVLRGLIGETIPLLRPAIITCVRINGDDLHPGSCRCGQDNSGLTAKASDLPDLAR
jgi:hypothetical protein